MLSRVPAHQALLRFSAISAPAMKWPYTPQKTSCPIPGLVPKSSGNRSLQIRTKATVCDGCGGAADALAEARSDAGSGVTGAGRDLRGGRVPAAASGMGSGAALRRGTRTDPGAEVLAGPQVVRGSGLYVSAFCH